MIRTVLRQLRIDEQDFGQGFTLLEELQKPIVINSYFADRTFPKNTSSTCSGLISGTRSTAAKQNEQVPFEYFMSKYKGTFDSN